MMPNGTAQMAMSVMRLLPSPPGKIVNGEILLRRRDGTTVDIARLDARGAAMRSIRGGEIAIVFQEPMTSLNPLRTIGDQIAEAVQVHQPGSRKDALDRALEMLTRVQMSAPKQRRPRHRYMRGRASAQGRGSKGERHRAQRQLQPQRIFGGFCNALAHRRRAAQD